MARRPSPSSLADAELRPPAAPAAPSAPPVESKRTLARKGKRGVAFWLNPVAFKQLQTIAFEEERSVQSLMEEATDLLFQNRGKHRIARAEGEGSR